jgi:hypothetical protein
MREKGFSFACSGPESSKEDEVFQRFIKTAEANPDKVINPFPQLARLSNLNQATTQPLVKMTYVPTTDMDILADTYYSVDEKFVTALHEIGHQQIAGTPAKILARLYLARAYAYLCFILEEESWNSMAWRELAAMNAHLTAICRTITLSEELLATALSFGTVEEMTNNLIAHGEEIFKKVPAALRRMEKKSIRKGQVLSPDFAALYYNTFKKVAEWCGENDLM